MAALASTPVEGFGRVWLARGGWMDAAQLLAEIDEYFRDGIALSRGDVVLDVGANIGAFAIYAARKCEGDVSLHCFEPAPISFAALEQNAIENEHLARAKPRLYNVALSSIEDAGKSTELHYFSKFPADSTLDMDQKRADLGRFFANQGARVGAKIERVLGRSAGSIARRAIAWAPHGPIGTWGVDAFMGKKRVLVEQDSIARVIAREKIERVDLLKIDVEGFETHVLAGIDAPSWPRIRQIALETNDQRVAEALALFEAKGFDRRAVSPSFAADRGVEYAIVSAMRSVGAA